MARRKNNQSAELLTETELIFMKALWERGASSAKDLQEELSEQNFAYTTVATMLKLMESKGFLSATKEGRSLIYSPTIELQEYRHTGFQNFVSKLFLGDKKLLLKYLVDAEELDKKDLEELEELIERQGGA